MEEGALISFDSPVVNRMLKPLAPLACMQSPLIPCPRENNPFDKVATAAAEHNADPFELVRKASAAPGTPTSKKALSPVSTPGKDTQCGNSLIADSELDISQLVTGRALISSTPHASMENLRAKIARPTTPLSARYKRQGQTFNELIGAMSVENLQLIVKKKMDNLEMLNRRLNLPPYNSNMRRSLSTSSLCPGTVQQQTFSQSKYDLSLGYESQLQTSSLQDETTCSLLQNLVEPPLVSIIKEEALKMAAVFDRLTAELKKDLTVKDGTPWKPPSIEEIGKIPPYRPPPGAFLPPDPKLTNLVPDDLRLERPPWEDEDYLFSSDDEEGLPKLKIFRLSTPKQAQKRVSTSDLTSLVNRYKKTRSSLKLDLDQPAGDAKQQNPADNVTTTICADEQATIVIPPNPDEDIQTATDQTDIADPPIEVPPVDQPASSLVPKKGPLKAVVPLPKMVKSNVPARSTTPKLQENRQSRQATPPSSTKSSTSSSGSSRIVPRRDVTRLGSFQRSRSASSPSMTSDASQKKMTSPTLPKKMTPVSRKGVLQALANAPLGPKPKLQIKSGVTSIKRPFSSLGKENLSK